jgi:hypothetical protein
MPEYREGAMRKAIGRRRLVGIGLLAGAVVLAGCGGSKSSSTTGGTSATASQTVKRLEVTVVNKGTAAAPGPRPFLAWAAELLGWPRHAEAASCVVSAGGLPAVPTDANGKATILNVPVNQSGNILVTINCNGVVSTVNISATPNTVVAVTIQVGPGVLAVTARNDNISEPSTPSTPSKPTQTSSKKSEGD